jgi:hypothetical protein
MLDKEELPSDRHSSIRTSVRAGIETTQVIQILQCRQVLDIALPPPSLRTRHPGLEICTFTDHPYQWNAFVEVLPLWLAPNMVTLLGFFFILANVGFLEIFMPDLVGPVKQSSLRYPPQY